MIDKNVMVLQNYTNLENSVLGACGGTYQACHDADQAMKIEAEAISSGAEEEEVPVPITFSKIKAEHEVSLCLC
jgi:hypothetical protein